MFAPAAQLEIVRLLLALAAHEDWKVHHMDVKSAFLNGDLTEEVYVEQPLGYEKKDEEEKVYKLKKALYGLKQAPRAWKSRLDQSLVSLGFTVYMKHYDDVDDRKSTTGMVFYLGPNPISWSSQKQKVVALSSCEAEFIAASMAACQGTWLRRLLADLIKREVRKVSVKIDNQAAISLCKNPVHHERSKHIDTRFRYIRECIEKGMIKVQHVNTNDQLADILTKSLDKEKFIEIRKNVGVQELKERANQVKEVNVGVNLVGHELARLGIYASTSPNRSRISSPSMVPNPSLAMYK